MNDPEKHIFLTGLPRSGTTWASKVIAHVSHRRQINEPFNWRTHPDRIKFHMKYIPSGEEDKRIIAIIQDAVTHSSLLHRFIPSKTGAIIKDVHICLAIEYIWLSLQPHLLILIRHPCALALSWSRLNYSIEFRIHNLFSQDLLMTDYLDQFRDHMTSSNDYHFMIGAYWGATYYVLNELTQKYNDWIWISHEELCTDPIQQYFDILENKFQLDIGPKQSRRLINYVDRHNKETAEYKPYNSIRSFSSIKDEWKRELSKEDIKNTLAGAEPFSLNRYYE